jgi:ribosomal protein S18 acetylase RimI-like enzyme
MPTLIAEATDPSDYAAFADLIDEYESWLAERYVDVPGLIDTIGKHQNMEAERVQLPVKFGPPKGVTLIARHDDRIAGAVAYRDLGDGVCEMKRMYVRDGFQGLGIGRQLCQALIERATASGFKSMVLDTGFLNTEAMALYTSLGFTSRGAYAHNPPEVEQYLRYFELQI